MNAVRHSWLIFAHETGMMFRQIPLMAASLINPLFYLFLFGPLLAALPGVGGYDSFTPGLLILLGLFGATSVGFGMLSQWRSGVLERFQVGPAGTFAVIAGNVGREAVALLCQGLIVMLLGIPLGLHVNFLGLLATCAIVLVLGVTFASFAIGVALNLRNENALAPVLTTVVVPLMLLSGVLLPMNLAPKWLGWISNINPVRYSVDVIRAWFRLDFTSATSIRGLIVTLVFAVLAFIWAMRTYAKMER